MLDVPNGSFILLLEGALRLVDHDACAIRGDSFELEAIDVEYLMTISSTVAERTRDAAPNYLKIIPS